MSIAQSNEAGSPETHRVVACRGGEATALEERPVPAPGRGELLLRLRAVGLCGTDLFKLQNGTAARGSVLGHELVGEVAAIGDDVADFRPGDRVAVPHHVPCGACLYCRRGNETMCETFRENLLEPGGFADYILVRNRATVLAARRVPDGVADEAAVFMEPAACVLRGVNRSGMPPDGTAVILGGGSMGLLHLLVLRAVSPDIRAIVIDPLAERRTLAERLGAAATAAPGEAASDAVNARTDGAGADAVFDTVGGAATLAAGLGLTRQGGTVVLFAHAPEGAKADFDLNNVFKFERRIVGTYSAALEEQADIFDLLVAGRFDPTPLVTHRMPLDDFQRGVDLARSQQALKVLYTRSEGATRNADDSA